MDDIILSIYRRSEIAWNTIAAQFAAELAPLPTEQVAAAVLCAEFLGQCGGRLAAQARRDTAIDGKGRLRRARGKRATRPCPTISPFA
jgi:hypothetical protein